MEPHVAYGTADYHVAFALVGAGLGVALVPAGMLGDVDRSPVSIHRLRGRTPVREVSIVHRRHPLALVQELVSLLRASADDVSRSAERL